MAELTLAQFAELTLRLERGELRPDVLRDAGLTEQQWLEQQMAWLERMATQLERQRSQLFERYLAVRASAAQELGGTRPGIGASVPANALSTAGPGASGPSDSVAGAPSTGFIPVDPPALYAPPVAAVPRSPSLGVGTTAQPVHLSDAYAPPPVQAAFAPLRGAVPPPAVVSSPPPSPPPMVSPPPIVSLPPMVAQPAPVSPPAQASPSAFLSRPAFRTSINRESAFVRPPAPAVALAAGPALAPIPAPAPLVPPSNAQPSRPLEQTVAFFVSAQASAPPPPPPPPEPADANKPTLVLAQLALLVAELNAFPDRSATTLAESGFDAARWQVEWAAWQRQFAEHPEERARYEPLVQYYTALRKPRESQP